MKYSNLKLKNWIQSNGLYLFFLVLMGATALCVWHFSRIVDEKEKPLEAAKEKMLEKMEERRCLYYYGGVVYPDGEWVCPAENNSLEIIDPGTSKNNLSTKLFYDRYEEAKKYGYSIKKWNGRELITVD